MKTSVFLYLVLSLLTQKNAGAVEIPINIGIGPAFYLIPEKLQEEKISHTGLSLHIKAVIDKASIEKHKNKIPKKYHDAVSKVDEVRVGFILVPDSLIFSPRKQEYGLELYGATWRPLGLGIPLKIGNAKLTVGTGFVFTYLYVNLGNYKLIDQEKKPDARNQNSQIFLEQVTHFLRPGIDLRLALELKISPFFLTSIGWASAYYIPQKIGGGVFELSKTKSQNLWRIHHGAFLLNFRFPHEAQL